MLVYGVKLESLVCNIYLLASKVVKSFAYKIGKTIKGIRTCAE